MSLIRQDDETARLRLLHVEAPARGTGVGLSLIETCLAFVAQAGSAQVTLWTSDINVAARQLYRACGFDRVSVDEPQRLFGRLLRGETWVKAVGGESGLQAPR